MIRFHSTGSLVELHSPNDLLKTVQHEPPKSAFISVNSKDDYAVDIFQCDSDEGMDSDSVESPGHEYDNQMMKSLITQTYNFTVHYTPDEHTPVACVEQNMPTVRSRSVKNPGRRDKDHTLSSSLPASLERSHTDLTNSILNEIVQNILGCFPSKNLTDISPIDDTFKQTNSCSPMNNPTDDDIFDLMVCQSENAHYEPIDDVNEMNICEREDFETKCPEELSDLPVAKSDDDYSCDYYDSGRSSLILESQANLSPTLSKKNVRFADEEGKNLEHIRHFSTTDEWSMNVKNRSKENYCGRSGTFSMSASNKFVAPLSLPLHADHQNEMTKKIPQSRFPESEKTCTCAPWQPTFAQPASQYLSFRNRVENNNVALENISVDSTQSSHLLLRGTIKVKNINFEKFVWLRMTTDGWRSRVDHKAVYSNSLSQCDPRFDTFEFRINLDRKILQDQVQFAIGLRTGEHRDEYWDNNEGCNFIIKQFASPRHLPHCMAKVFNQSLPHFNAHSCTEVMHTNEVKNRFLAASTWIEFDHCPVYY